MFMLISIALFVVSLAVLIKSSDLFTENAEKIGTALGMPHFLVGVTIVAMGTSLPELASSMMAAAQGNSEIVFGNVVGSNIANILLILGVSMLFLKKEVKVKWDLFHGDISFIIASTLMIGAVMWDGVFTVAEAALLFIGYVAYSLYNYDIHKKNHKSRGLKTAKADLTDIAVLIISMALVALSADYLIKSAVDIATELNIGKEVVGLTAIAIGTSLPELAVSIAAVRRGSIEVALGNVSGSNIFNALIVPTVPMLISQVAVAPLVLSQSFPYLVIATAMFLSVILDHKVHKFEGALMVMFYVLFLMHTLSL